MILPIKKKWFDMIKSGEKREEYREIKPYYTTRFLNACFLKKTVNPVTKTEWIEPYKSGIIGFRNGYSATSPTIFVKCHIKIDNGRPECGAVKGVKYYALVIEDVLC